MSTKKHTKTHSTYAFESNTNSVAASQMRNALNKLADSSKLDDAARAKFENELDSFFTLFRRYLVEKSSRTTLEWDKIKSPNPDEVVKYEIISQQPENVSNLSKLAVLKLNGGLGTSMGCVGPKSVIEVREGNTFLDLSVRQIEYLNRQYDSDVPLLLMNSFNTDKDTEHLIKKYSANRIRIRSSINPGSQESTRILYCLSPPNTILHWMLGILQVTVICLNLYTYLVNWMP
ncbi:UTP-glucose-1-phosphate uridylyltransferase [Saccharomyces pastorianus]|uniref:UTP--glucose-1-phosphate uridylyltransferase n=1 Tax=Saccharomyces pastorianus TaxID=27292 RepID=A0A6C1DUS4_SACPS|nr:UTP-glucose-1-phosphate uridylyltransferase [Saccharomyces pastorianus]